MMKTHAVISVLVVGFCMFTGFASNVDAFSFTDSVVNPDFLTWTHTLENDDFDPALSCGEAIEVTAATLTITLNVTLNSGFGVWTATEDSTYLDTLILTETPEGSHTWIIDLADIIHTEEALNAIEERSFTVHLIENSGTINDVGPSELTGNSHVVPIPASLLLLGSGLVCVVGLRRKSRRG